MKGAAVFPGSHTLKIISDVPEPKLQYPASVKLRILKVGICATDREIANFVFGTPPPGFDYLVMGHEGFAEITETGPEVKDLKPGDLVVPTVRRPCHDPNCIACRHGRPDFCLTGQYREHGILGMHGFLTEFVVDEAQYMRKVPMAIRDVAVLVEPLTIAEKGFIQADRIQSRLPWHEANSTRHAVVTGAGPVGLLGAMVLRLRGYETTVYSREPETDVRAELSRAIGARYVSADTHTLDQMAKDIGNIDLIYEATGSAHIAFAVLNVLGRNGVCILTGVPGAHGPEPVDLGALVTNMTLKNQCVFATVNAGNDAFDRAIQDLAELCTRWPDAVRGLITRRFKLEEFEEPIRDTSGIKSIIEISA